VLTRISRMAKGSLRDAIKFLEQAITIGASQEHVFEMLGIPDADDVLIGLREKNAVTTVKALDLLYQTGYNTDQIVMEMIDQLRLGLITRLQNKQPTAMLTRLIEVLHGSLRVPQEVLEARLVLFISEME
jgi:DNA polymerase III gamma/tau subunit